MGWYHSMTPEEMAESGLIDAPACSISNKPASTTRTPEESVTAPAAPKEPAVPQESAPSGTTSCPLPPTSAPPPPPPEAKSIYHLCQKTKWEEAKASGEPYFPPTFIADGKFTRATVNKSDLVSTANLFYKDTPGHWIVLEIDCKTLYALGIAILAQEAPESTKDEPVKCLQLFGGISTTLPGLISNIYEMKRDNSSGEFLAVKDAPPIVNKKVNEKVGKKQPAEQAKPKKSGMKRFFGSKKR